MNAISRHIFLSAFLFAITCVYGQTWTIKLGAGGASIKQTDLKPDKNNVSDPEATVEIECEKDEDCANLNLKLVKDDGTTIQSLGATASTDKRKTFKFSQDMVSSGTKLAIAQGNNPPFMLYPLGSSSDKPQPATLSTKTIDQWLATPCPGTYQAASYGEAENIGEVILTPTGNILSSALDLFDENDKLRVKIVGDARLLPLLKVRRTSAFRNKGIVRIVGEGIQIPAGIVRQAARAAPSCSLATFILQDFEPGKGEVEILVNGDPDRTIGNFEFNVNPLYTGMLTLGGIWTQAVDPALKLVASGGDKAEMIIVEGNSGTRDFLYALLYTPYIWGKRDLEKHYSFYKHLNPTIGVGLNDIVDNGLVGVSIDLPTGFLITAGVHARRVKVLADGAAAAIGKPFTTGENPETVKLPTANAVRAKFFIAASVDLRAAVKIITAAVSAVAGN